MPPKGRRPRRDPNNGPDKSTEEVYDIISLGDTSDSSSVIMTGRRHAPRKGKAAAAPTSRRGGRSAQQSRSTVPDVFQDLLAETLNSAPELASERPLKRRKTRRADGGVSTDGSVKALDHPVDHKDDDDDIDFEDVLPQTAEQTVYRDSDEDSEGGSDIAWEEFDVYSGTKPHAEHQDNTEELDLTLNSRNQLQPRPTPTRRKVTSADRTLRLEIHKMHVLCLLSHLSRRNDWCNDGETQAVLKALVNNKILANLRPPSKNLSQFRQTDLLRTGLEQLGHVWQAKFNIIARGMRRPLWVEDESQLKNFKLPPDSDPPIELSDFRAAAKVLSGSRDVGAQLYCALLRSVGLEARLVCSLQPLPFAANAKTIAPPTYGSSPRAPRTPSPEMSGNEEVVDVQGEGSPFAQGASSSHAPFSARRRLGHPNAADYHLPSMAVPVKAAAPKPKRKRINESPYPIFWVEVLDEAHQKWLPVDPLVTGTCAKLRVFEPPASDQENVMSYAIAFEDDGVARDVTRRYAKAYNSKTRKIRVEITDGGVRWWNRVLRRYKRDWSRDLDQIEDSELAAMEAREPMPKSIADFKDHPSYALERHLRKNEVLINRHEVGKIAAGRDSSAPGGKKLESVYRRSAVQVARSADRWYRLGRDIKIGEQPVKITAARRKDEDADEEAGVGLYTESQTELYQAPPVVNGRVPRNAYGNLDIYVPSMIPPGAVHIAYEEARAAARLLGIDYAEAVTGFKFEGRHGRPVVNGIVVAKEYKEAVEAVIDGYRDERAQAEEEMRSLAALRMWKKFLVGLRIKERVDAYEVDGEDADETAFEDDGEGMQSEEYEYDDDGGGGFFPE